MVIAFVGLSNKPDKAPLDSTTKSGALIDEIEKNLIQMKNLIYFQTEKTLSLLQKAHSKN